MSNENRDPLERTGIFGPAEPEPVKKKGNGVIEESVGFLIPVQCATVGHDPLPDELPITKNGESTGIAIRFCKTCKIVYWEELVVATAPPVSRTT